MTTVERETDDRRPVAALPTFTRARRAHQRVPGGGIADRVAQRARAEPVDDRHRPEAGHGRVVQVPIERLERLLHAGTAQVER
jgi:hypothetical protein